ncbi:MAG: TetR/AcrR family transcriptional regulator [Actinomycetes bacterium]
MADRPNSSVGQAPQARASNGMYRARAQILAAAAALVASGGLRALTMASLARKSAVAKATVYNHFRDRDDALQALLEAERNRLIAHCAAVPQDGRLVAAARWLSESSVIGGLRRHDPAVLVSLADQALSESSVHDVVREWCAPDGDPDAALRWLVSFAVVPCVPGESGESAPGDQPRL